MRLLHQLSLFVASALCTVSLNFSYAQESPPALDDNPIDTPTDPVTGVDKDKIEKKIRPDFFLDFEWGEEVLNLTPHPKNTFFEAASDTLVMGDYSKGFRVVKYSDIAAGVGARLSWHWPNQTGLAGKLWLHVGLIPMAGKTLVSHQFQPTFENAMNARARNVPLEATDFNSWFVNDSVNYSSTGGLIFSVGVGVPGLNAGTDFVVQGTFSTYVEKVSADEVYVMISNTEAKSLNMQVDATVVQVGVTKYKEILMGTSKFLSV